LVRQSDFSEQEIFDMRGQSQEMSMAKKDKQNGRYVAMDDEGTYCPEKSCRIASALAQLGNATDADIAEALDISLSDFPLLERHVP
jgi:hypothetical protein